ncbi:MAG: hypothetical protein MJ227_01200 [Bacilli bacterium]|nr:hypothetical protein [Bacilli bacterium]
MKKLKIFFLGFLLLAIPAGFAGFSTQNAVKTEAQEAEVQHLETAQKYEEYWTANVRPTPESSICDVDKDTYNFLYYEYNVMVRGEKVLLDEWTDLAGEKVKASLDFLTAMYYPKTTPSNTKNALPEDTTLTIIISIAFIGMTAIGLFFVLKNKNLID